MHGSGVPIWFFIGISLLVNGVLIAGAGIWEWVHPPLDHVILFNLHANFWWGTALALFGALYCYKFAPGRKS